MRKNGAATPRPDGARRFLKPLFPLAGRLHRLHYLVQVKGGRLLPGREFLKGHNHLAGVGLGRHADDLCHPFHPLVVAVGVGGGPLEGIHAQVKDQGHSQIDKGVHPDPELPRLLFFEHQLPAIIAHGHQLAVIVPVEKSLPGPVATLAGEQGQQVVAVQVDFKGRIAGFIAFGEFFSHIGGAGGSQKGGHPVGVGGHFIDGLAALDLLRPAHEARHPVAALPVGVLLTPERSDAAVRPHIEMRAVVGGVDHDGILSNAQVVQLLEQLPHVAVMLQHAVGVKVQVGLAVPLRRDVGVVMHPGGVEPDEEWFFGLVLAVNEIQGRAEEFLIHRFHALFGQGAGVFDFAASRGFYHAPGAELLFEGRILGIGRIFRSLFGVEVIEVAEELVKTVGRGQELILVAQVVLAELASGVAQGFEEFGQGRVLLAEAQVGARQPHLGHARAHRHLPGDEGGPSSGAGLLAVIIGETHTFSGNAVDVGGLVAHHGAAVVAEVPVADVIAHDDQNVGLVLRPSTGRATHHHRQHQEQPQGRFPHLLPPLYLLLDKKESIQNHLIPTTATRLPRLNVTL